VPELPDIAVYIEALAARVLGHRLDRVRLASPFLLRSVTPPLSAIEGSTVRGLRRLGKRIVFEFDGPTFLVLHLMIAGRLKWKPASALRATVGKPAGAALAGRAMLAAFDFDDGTLLLTEAGAKRRASLYVVGGEAGLAEHDPGGVEPLAVSTTAFAERLRLERRTLKRALTDPRLFSGIGNAYSDEILHSARLSPLQWTTNLSDDEIARLHAAVKSTLVEWTDRLRAKTGEGFPEKVTAFQDDMAVHGKFGKPCPRCGSPVQHIVYAANECNYCPTCQTGGRLLADRSLSRLLGDDWPRTLEELEEMKKVQSAK
jgi:formamidopyrimidine-DNA glycosylase